jgi:predicted  nucleic acid-binding Zn-ribbon protein
MGRNIGGWVNEQLEHLVKLQELDSRIISLSRRIRAIPEKISTMEKPLKQAEANLDAQKKNVHEAEKKKRDREMELEENNERIGKLRDRTAQIKDNKAYTAHLKEIEAAEKHAYKIEDGILELMEKIESESIRVGTAEEDLTGKKQEAEALKKELDAEVKEATGKLDVMKAGRAEHVEKLDKELYDEYMNLLTSLDGLAVTEAVGEVCGGCNMNIMPQLFVQIKENREIFRCPQCKRILFYREEAEAPRE